MAAAVSGDPAPGPGPQVRRGEDDSREEDAAEERIRHREPSPIGYLRQNRAPVCETEASSVADTATAQPRRPGLACR